MATANEDLLDATLRHQIGIRRLAGGEVNQILPLLDKSDAELRELIRRRLSQGIKNTTTKRYINLLRDIRKLRAETFTAMRAQTRSDLLGLASVEQEFSKRLFQLSIPVQMDFAAASAETLGAIVRTQPFAGGANAARTLQQWWNGVETVDQARIRDALQLGITQQETVDQMVRRVRAGTDLTRNNAEAVVRTAVNHVSNAARESFFDANSDVVDVLRWVATLDGRTSLVCAGRDGHFIMIAGKDSGHRPLLQPQGARPPAHPNCRSLVVSVLDPDGIAELMPDRPYVRDSRTRRMREKDFRAEAKANAGDKWKGMDEPARRAAVKDLKREWSRKNVGTVPGDMDYDTWLRKQPIGFQNEVLGTGKARMFRKGLKLDKYVDRQGAELTLKQLRDRHPDFVEGAT